MLQSAVTDPDAVFVGIDWGNSDHQLCVLDAVGGVVDKGKVSHDVAGVRELERRPRLHRSIAGIAVERSPRWFTWSAFAPAARSAMTAPRAQPA